MAWLGLIFDQVHSLRVKAGFVFFLVSLFGGSEDYRRLSKTIYRDNFGGGCVNVQRGTVDLLSLYLLDCYTFKLASTTALSGFIAASYYLDLFG